MLWNFGSPQRFFLQHRKHERVSLQNWTPRWWLSVVKQLLRFDSRTFDKAADSSRLPTRRQTLQDFRQGRRLIWTFDKAADSSGL